MKWLITGLRQKKYPLILIHYTKVPYYTLPSQKLKENLYSI